MRSVLLAAAVALVGPAVADVAHMHRHGHDVFHHRRSQPVSSNAIVATDTEAICGCTTEVITIYGSPVPVLISTPEPTTTITSQIVTTVSSTTSTTLTVVVTASPSPLSSPPSLSPVPSLTPSSPAPSPSPSSPAPSLTLPTAAVTSFTSTGVYTIPATTVTVTDTTTVCGATTASLSSGTNTYGGVTTVVDTSTVIVCPFATVKPSGTTVTSIIDVTTYLCPSAGTYTIAPTTTSVSSPTVIVYPVPETYAPGTYTHSEQIVTVTRTDFVYVCPFTAVNQPIAAPTSPVYVPPAPTPSPPAPSPPSPSTQSSVESPVSEKPSTSTPVVQLAGVAALATGDHMGITYSPYTNEGGCKTKSEIHSDIFVAKEKGFTHIRVYSTDCNTLEFVGEACEEHGLLLILGVFIKDTGISGAQSQVQAISSWAKWDMVTLIVVGNEAISSGFVTASELAGFVRSCKQTFASAGYSGPVTTTEPINIWQSYGSTLCGAVDILGANIHPFFNSAVTANEAGNFVLEEIKVLRGICQGLDVINLETGWPSNGNPNGDAVPNAANQVTALKSIQAAFGGSSVFFSYSNDGWKNPGPFDVEQYWGCIDAF